MENNFHKKIILVTGGFDPLHKGHISYFKEAKKKCNFLVVGLNSDKWLIRKKNINFLPIEERLAIVSNLKFVDKVIVFNDDDNSAIDAIKICLNFSEEVIFANGGDRVKKNIPEYLYYKNIKNVHFQFNIGGSEKVNSSSWILNNFLEKNRNLNLKNSSQTKEVIKPWGDFSVISSGSNFKIKLIKVRPNMRLSLQSHKYRSEHWIINNGTGEVIVGDSIKSIKSGDYVYISKNTQHRIKNTGHDLLSFVEVAYGDYIEEDDITRFEDDYGRNSNTLL